MYCLCHFHESMTIIDTLCTYRSMFLIRSPAATLTIGIGHWAPHSRYYYYYYLPSKCIRWIAQIEPMRRTQPKNKESETMTMTEVDIYSLILTYYLLVNMWAVQHTFGLLIITFSSQRKFFFHTYRKSNSLGNIMNLLSCIHPIAALCVV